MTEYEVIVTSKVAVNGNVRVKADISQYYFNVASSW